MKLSQMDAVDFLKTLGDGSVDLLITDPPYESLEKHRKIGTTTRLKHSKGSSNDWFRIFKNERFEELFQQVYRVLAKNSHFYLQCDEETLFIVRGIAEQVGFKFWKSIIWDKEVFGMGYHYRNQTERIAFFEKGKLKLNSLSIPDILRVKRVYRGFPTEKPVELYDILIQQSSQPGDVVVDPFFGSGSCLISAENNDRVAIGNDIADAAHKHLANSLTRGNLQFNLQI